MREIKYRVWDKQHKVMSEVTMLLFITNELDHTENAGEPKSMEHFELMQFTGLRDKNGKEIWEGDIVNAPHCGIMPIVFGEPYNASFCVGNSLLGVIDSTDIEVIGTIHEHPELLNR